MTLFIILGIIMTLVVSKFLSMTFLKGMPSSFILELPPYRKPSPGSIIIRSLMDRTVFVLGRAAAVAAPAGLVIWLLANIPAGDLSLLDRFTGFCHPFGQLIGVDGVIIVSFILGFPANEIVIPIMLMCYMSTGTLTDYASLSELHHVLTAAGWDMQTAFSVLILCLFHFPCATSCLTVKKETGSWKWTAVSILLPASTGFLICLTVNMLLHLFHLPV